MNDTQQQIFDQYIAWLFDDGDNVEEALRGLKEIALPEAVEPLTRFIKYTRVKWKERWTHDHYSYWDTCRAMAREALDAIYTKAGQEALQDEASMPGPSEDPDLSGAQ